MPWEWETRLFSIHECFLKVCVLTVAAWHSMAWHGMAAKINEMRSFLQCHGCAFKIWRVKVAKNFLRLKILCFLITLIRGFLLFADVLLRRSLVDAVKSTYADDIRD